MFLVDLLGVVYQLQSPSGISESGFDLGLNRIEPCKDFHVRVSATCERAGCAQLVSCLFRTGGIAGESRCEGHMSKYRGTEERIVGLMRSL
ncbi:hypothetical protein NRB20_58090 [Nocardia sp. RB20]|uniref:Uncharacterized protein n=1 Tax=Nocardia macrotermitis TaxID=2585198 RepID=A0A7K0DAE8_9NOCA|nr:hypothetical protein [Nocardia macrotermitis]